MKTLQRATNTTAGLKTLINKVPNGSSWMAMQIETQSDSDKVTREIQAFIGKELKPVTVVLLKGL